ncbi:hypothetical protein JZ785_02725 [Alicyclobacillus curvatus]|nr:hypothetical protein JZ785_02725 [Alicyclobacillus curvatus]
MKKYCEYIYVTGILVIPITFYILLGRDHTMPGMPADESPFSSLFLSFFFNHKNVEIWLVIVFIDVSLMLLVGYFTRTK